MTPEERTLLTDLFQRLRQAETGPRDADAELFIRDSVRAQPGAPYCMAQTVLVQQQALTAAQARIEELERQVRDAARPAPAGSGFLGGLLGGGRNPWNGAERPAAPAAQAQRGPWGAPPGGSSPPGYGVPPYAPATASAAPRGGGFLGGAMQTAAGVAGGILAASAISSLLHGNPGPFGEALAAEPARGDHEPAAPEPEGHPAADDPAQDDPGYQEADYHPDADPGEAGDPGDAGGDFGGGDGWT